MARLPVLIRQTRVFELVVAGKSYGEIGTALGISDDTIARDMRAVADQVEAVCRERASEILAVAIAQIAEVRAAAQREYEEDRRREKAWKAGKLDYEQRKRKRLESTMGTERSEELTNVRPPFRSDRAKYLDLMRQCALDLVDLTGVKKVLAAPQSDGTLTIQVEYADA